MANSVPRFYRVNRNLRLFSFGDEIGSVPVLGRPLQDEQRAAIEAAGAELIDVGSETTSGNKANNPAESALRNESAIPDDAYFVFDADLYFSPSCIEAAIELARDAKTNLRFCLADNTFNRRYVLPDSRDPGEYLKFPFYFKRRGASETRDIVIPQKVYPFSFAVPRQIIPQGQYHYDQCATILGRVASPFHLLQLNLAANFARTTQNRGRLPEWLTEKLFPVQSPRYHWALRRMNRIGRNCKIHRTAVIEGSVIGDNVTIGANAVVRLSQIGEGTTIHDNTTVNFSVLGRNNYIVNGNFINLCMTYDDVFLIHGPYQFSIYGRNVALMAVINCDFRLDQKNITIPTDRGIVDSGQTLLGLACGHEAVIGGGNTIAPGRIVPNGLKITPPDHIITSFDGLK